MNSIIKQCKVEGCEKYIWSRGLCGSHYQRLREGRIVDSEIRQYNQHGMTNHPQYKSWQAMVNRCSNPNNTNYAHYGGRGIKVCERWLNFANFITDVGERPDGMTLDRKDKNSGYAPNNVRWATQQEQILNRGTNKNNTSGFRSIYFEKRTQKWEVRFKRSGINYIKKFTTIEEAVDNLDKMLKDSIDK